MADFTNFDYEAPGGYHKAGHMLDNVLPEIHHPLIEDYKDILEMYMYEYDSKFFKHDGNFADERMEQLIQDWGLEHAIPGVDGPIAAYRPRDPIPWKSLGGSHRWTDVAHTRMDWDSVAHILEVYSQHGGEPLLQKYFSGSDDEAILKQIEKDALRVMTKFVSPILPARSAHVVKAAAKRLRAFLKSGPHGHRSFKPKPTNTRSRRHQRMLQKLKREYYEYNFPKMETATLHRIGKLPGVQQHIRDNFEGDNLPLYLYDRETYKKKFDKSELWDEEPHYPAREEWEPEHPLKAAAEFESQPATLRKILDALNHF